MVPESQDLRPEVIARTKRRAWLSVTLLVFLAGCFVIQVPSPLRLNNDAITLLSMAESAARGTGFLNSGRSTVFPSGYPALLAVLLRIGFAHSWVIISLNEAFLFVGLLATYHLLRREFFEDKSFALNICSFFLLSYVVIKHVTIALTDVPFFCCSMCCLTIMSQASRKCSGSRSVMTAGAAWLLALVAITVRRVGFALIPPLIFMVVSPSTQCGFLLRQLSRRAKVAVLALLVVACFGTVVAVHKTSTLSDFTDASRQVTMPVLVSRIFKYRLTELGELLTNFPASKTPTKLRFVTPWIGLPLLLLTLLGLATKFRAIGSTEVFLFSYIGILFAWPYYDARFWLPVIPLLSSYSVLALNKLRFPSVLARIYCVLFALLGLGAIAYSTRITFAGSKFPERYGDGNLKATYCAALRSCRDKGEPENVNAKVLELLKEYQ